MKITTTGKSLNDLYVEYGEGANGFCSHWWKDQVFAHARPEAGEYEVLIEKKSLTNLTFEEQKEKTMKDYSVPHPAILVEALLTYHKDTGKYLMEDWYSRTSLLDSDGGRVNVGRCGASGVDVGSGSDGFRVDYLGLSASRKFNKSIESGRLESFDFLDFDLRLKNVEQRMDKYNLK